MRTTRKQFLYGAAASALMGSMPARGSKTTARRRPNVLFVMADEWRAQAFGHMGDTNARTPALDRFSREAISFSEAISGTPVCCPARASIVTGQYALTNAIYINDVPLAPTGKTLGQAFADAGYQTGYIGKWHLYGSPEGNYERRLSYIPPEFRFGFEYWKVCECTHQYNRSLYYDGNDTAPKYWQGYDAIAQTDDAISYIDDKSRGSDPYFLVLSWGPPHFPYSAPKEYTDLYKDRDIALRPNVPDAVRDRAVEELRGYYAAIQVLDDCFARLMAAVEKNGADDTIVVFASDHGEMAFSQGLAYKLYPWEESVRIPFMLRYPREFGRRAAKSRAMLNTPDIMPTLLGLVGIGVPKGVQGTDFAAMLRGERHDSPVRSAFISLPVSITTARAYGIDAYRGVRTGRHTYVRSLEGPWLLYDNLEDPFQKRNLINLPQVATVQAALERELQSWLLRLSDEFLPGDEYLKRDHLTHYFETATPVGFEKSPWGDWQSTMSPPTEQSRSVDAALADLLDDVLAAVVLIEVSPQLARINVTRFLGLSSPRAISIVAPEILSRGQLAELDRRLKELPRPLNR